MAHVYNESSWLKKRGEVKVDLQYVVEVQEVQGRGAQVWREQEEQWEGRQAGSRQHAIGFSTSTTWGFYMQGDFFTGTPLKVNVWKT